MVVGFTRARLGDRLVHPEPVGFVFGVVGFIRGRLVHSGAP